MMPFASLQKRFWKRENAGSELRPSKMSVLPAGVSGGKKSSMPIAGASATASYSLPTRLPVTASTCSSRAEGDSASR
jgi:hypothetical protein